MDSPYNYDNLFTVLGEELQITAKMNEIIVVLSMLRTYILMYYSYLMWQVQRQTQPSDRFNMRSFSKIVNGKKLPLRCLNGI